MLKNYLKIAWRNIWKNKVFSLINIVGLSIGLSATFVIGAIIYHDLTFDKFHFQSDRIYRVVTDFSSPQGDFHNRGVAVPLGQELKKGMAGIETTATFYNTFFHKIENKASDKVFRNTRDAVFADGAYFELFHYEWLAGKPGEAISNPNEVVLTKSRAAKYFPHETPQQVLGNTLVYNDSILVQVTGIVNNFEERSDFNFQEFLSLQTANNTVNKDQVVTGHWNATNSASQVFIKIREDGELDHIQDRLDQLAAEHADEQMTLLGQKRTFRLQPLNDIHFNADYGVFNSNNQQASKMVLGGLALIALFLLLLGCINFINLNTAQATKRSKEIGIRKTLGSSKRQLIIQFMGETFLLTMVAAILSIFLSSSLLRIFSDFVPEGVGFELFTSPILIISTIILLVSVTFMSGFYPALVLSNFKPVSVLKNQIFQTRTKSPLRKYLVVFQFVIAQVFIIVTLLVGKQLNYMMNKDMGFKTEANVFVRAWHDEDFDKRLNFVSKISAIPQISKVSLGGDPPASGNSNAMMATFMNDKKEINTSLKLLMGDLNYRELYNIDLLAGRERLNDTIHEYIINETYSKILGFEDPAKAIGQTLKVNDETVTIVGVMSDFYQRSLRSDIEPMAIVGDLDRGFYHQFNTVHFSLEGQTSENWPGILARVEDAWKTIYPDEDFEVNFMDDTIAQFYGQERKTSVLLKWAMGLSILISCLGLLGLVIYTTERRTKEIGIRKILGATLSQLNLLLCREFLVLVGIAFTIAMPIAWWGMDNWLQDFAHKTELSWWVFALGGAAMLMIALVVISIRTIAVANANPVKSLRTE